MKRQAALDLDQFPDSPYARELRRGFPGLCFMPDLERDYQAFHLDRVRNRVRIFQFSILALLLAITLHLLLVDHVPVTEVAYSWIGLAVPMCAVLVAVSFTGWYEPVYLTATRLALPVLGVAAAMGIADRTIFGHADAFYFLPCYCFALFFLGGLLFHEAVLASALLVIAHGVALAYVHQPLPEVIYYVSVLAITALVGAFMYRGMEYQLRTSFLERGLMSELAARDGLTGLKNRGAFDAHLPRMWGQAMRDRRNLALILIDVDHFKAYNDRYGHQAGDKALRKVAQVVQAFARRPLDMAARYGGEEFVLALFDLASEHVHEIAEQLRQAVQALQIPHDDSSAASVVTTSVGVSLVGPRHGRSAAGALQLADEALYSAKRRGRNCVQFAELDPSFATGIFRRRTMPPRNPPRRSTG
jgi:diguanylate cyclase (GGDEF)-like protein